MSIDYEALARAESAWNTAADENNQWDTLGFDEMLGLYEAAKRDEQPDELTVDIAEAHHAIQDAWTYFPTTKDEWFDLLKAVATIWGLKWKA